MELVEKKSRESGDKTDFVNASLLSNKLAKGLFLKVRHSFVTGRYLVDFKLTSEEMELHDQYSKVCTIAMYRQKFICKTLENE